MSKIRPNPADKLKQRMQVLAGGGAADAQERIDSLVSRMSSRGITLEDFNNEYVLATIEKLKAMGNPEDAKDRLAALMFGGHPDFQAVDPLLLHNQMFKALDYTFQDADAAQHTQAIGGKAKEKGADQNYSGEDIVEYYRSLQKNYWKNLSSAAGAIATSDVAKEDTFDDSVVRYLEKPLTLLASGLIGMRTKTDLEIRYPYEDSTKVEGDVAAAAEGAALAMLDFGTTEKTRKLYAVGGQTAYNLEWTVDSERSYFMPYLRKRILEKRDLKVEDFVINGDGSAPNPKGFKNETGLQTASELAYNGGLFDVGQITDVLLSGIGKVFSSSGTYKWPTGIICNPLDWLKIMSVEIVSAAVGTKADHEAYKGGWALGSPLSQGGNLPMLLWAPLIPCWSVAANEWYVGDFRGTYAVFHGGGFREEEGTINDQLVKRQRTIAFWTWMNQYTEFPQAIVKMTKAASSG